MTEIETQADEQQQQQQQQTPLPGEFSGKTPEELVKLILEQREQNKQILMGVDQRLKELDQRLKAAPPQTQPKPETKPPDWFTDPDKAAERLIEEKVGPYAQVLMTAEEQRQLAEIQQLDYYGDFKDEIEQALARAAPLQKAQPGFARIAYDYVIGRHIKEVTKKEAEKAAKQAEFHETRTSAATAKGKRTAELNPNEKSYAEARGLSEEEFALWRDNPDAAREAARNKK